MKPPVVGYVRATDTDEAVALLQQHGPEAKVLAGGQSLVPLMSFRLATPSVLVDVNQVSELSYVRQDNGSLVVGAMTRQCDVETDEVAAASVPLLRQALGHVGHVTIRNRGTVGGSVAHADPAAELPMLVTGLGGELDIRGPGGTRTVPAEEFFVSSFTTVLDYDEMLTAVRLPRLPDGTGVAVEELAKRHGDFAMVAAMAAVHLDQDGAVDLVRVAVAGVHSVPVRLHEVESALLGSRPTAALVEEAAASVPGAIEPTSDVHAPAAYRRDMARLLVRRALTTAAEGNGTRA